MKPASIEQLLHGHTPIQDRFWALVESALAIDDPRIYAMLMEKGERILLRIRAVPPLPELEVAEEQLDGAEGVLQVRYAGAAGDDARAIARDRVRNIDEYRATLLKLRQALIEKHQL